MKLTATNSQRLDRPITIEQYSATLDTFGGEVLSWSTFVECWASADWPMAHSDEGQEAAQRTATERIDFTVRWVDGTGTEPKMRVVFDGKYYDILAVVPQGRQRFLVLKCETKD